MKNKISKISSLFLLLVLLFQIAIFTAVLSSSKYQLVNAVEEEIKEIVHYNDIKVVKDLFCTVSNPFEDELGQRDSRIFYSSNHISTDTPPPEC